MRDDETPEARAEIAIHDLEQEVDCLWRMIAQPWMARELAKPGNVAGLERAAEKLNNLVALVGARRAA